ncbi:MAG: hypothetical protein EOO44_11800 [Flavobacterium sp.]|nr:MAG: hypothetical protein EOO44_11800 [Flavobacterium sp.]
MDAERRIFPDFNKLIDYFNYTPEQIEHLNKNGIVVESEHYNKEYYWYIADEFKKLCLKSSLTEHYDNLLYLVFKFNDHLVGYSELIEQNYEDEKISKEVATFLLAFKTSKPNDDFRISIKSALGTATIRNNAVSKWMAELIYNAVEQNNIPIGIFGEKIGYDIFGEDFAKGVPLKIERLENASKLKRQKPSVMFDEYLLEFCKYLRIYLESQTHLTRKPNTRLPSLQAEFFFDLFVILGHMTHRKTRRNGIDLVHALFKNKS